MPHFWWKIWRRKKSPDVKSSNGYIVLIAKFLIDNVLMEKGPTDKDLTKKSQAEKLSEVV